MGYLGKITNCYRLFQRKIKKRPLLLTANALAKLNKFKQEVYRD